MRVRIKIYFENVGKRGGRKRGKYRRIGFYIFIVFIGFILGLYMLFYLCVIFIRGWKIILGAMGSFVILNISFGV